MENKNLDQAKKSLSPQKKLCFLAVAAVLAGFSTGCANVGATFKETFNSDDPCSNNARNIGIAAGAIGGAILGQVLGGKNNKALSSVLAAAAGGALGGLIGYDIDKRRCAIAKIAKENQLNVTMTDLNVAQDSAPNKAEKIGMSLNVVDQGEQFRVGSATPTPKAESVFAQIAKEYRLQADKDAEAATQKAVGARNAQIRILLVGHTDDTGSSKTNADLSEQRARAIARIFAKQGFSEAQIFYQGAGETLPISDNHTEAGRLTNRRVEVVDLGSDQAFAAYLSSRQPNTAFYRQATETPVVATRSKEVPSKTAVKKPLTTPTVAAMPTPSAPIAAIQPEKMEKIEKKTAIETTAPAVAMPKRAPSGYTGRTVDFGGDELKGNPRAIDIGKVASADSGFSFIKTAHADETFVGSCIEDRPRIANGVKSLSNGEEVKLKTTDYLPGLYNTSWTSMVNGHLVALTQVAVLRDGGAPAHRPDLLIYENYQAGKDTKANYNGKPEVNAYQGEKGVLYRVFVNGPIRCMDMVVAKNNADATMFYAKEGKTYQANYAPRLAR